MKNFDYWKRFVNTGKVDDYLNYIACTREEAEFPEFQLEFGEEIHPERPGIEYKEGGAVAGINYRDGNGPVGHAGW
ncbi:MAG TPA: hypothetical protein GXX75_19860 [Clostridiales bacterium]|nr:hypothetical protein [Clostridiales bacterium]